MNESICTDCGQTYEDTLDGLIEHIFQSATHEKAVQEKKINTV